MYRKNFRLVLLLLVLILSGCGEEGKKYTFSDYEFKDKTERLISLMLKDPSSAKFEELYVIQHNRLNDTPSPVMVCGEVNAKNAFGAYAGKKYFFVQYSKNNGNNNDYDVESALVDGFGGLPHSAFVQVWNEKCYFNRQGKIIF